MLALSILPAKVMERLNLFHKFLLILSLSTLLGIVALAGTISYLLKKNLVEEEGKDTASLMEVLSRSDLSPQMFAQRLRQGEGVAFARFADRIKAMPEIFRVKIYDKVGTLVWSDEERLVGKNFKDNLELKEALGGKVQVAMGLFKREHIYEGDRYNENRLIEVYVPL